MSIKRMSRRDFVGHTAIGAGWLALAASDHAWAGDFSDLLPTLKKVWSQAVRYTIEFAEAMPMDRYPYKPTEEVFSFAQQLLHLAGANFWFFSAVQGEKPPKSEEELIAEGKSGAEVIALLEESFKYGDAVVGGLTDVSVKEEVKMGENSILTWKLLFFNVDHIAHHRGQMVTYLRLNGIKPPQYRSGFFS